MSRPDEGAGERGMELIAYAERAVALVNTHDPAAGSDRLASEDDVLDLLPPSWTVTRTAARDALADLLAARPRLRQVFEQAAVGHHRRAVHALNTLLSDFPVSLSISGHELQDWHMHLADDDAGQARTYVTGAVFGLAYTIAERGIERLGMCCATSCQAVFVDTTTNASRRYCSDRCATRTNVAAYRARVKAAPGDAF
ncbi:CGNR zinc finger domain-containing protein [Catenulispora sp. NF23]|uniref:CGNR zinc finger domain-containing protein n=1 Tax=Catenulispora pinistramenti TaxID=2705254 RepID=UPI001BAD1846|nr:CGNR zinc finger domain-containing protein [Catenulispora pinistramenti]MBS2534088.1 CGNR zinc finger domain-containing protein [Catenulispora pinistramenti]